MIVSWINGNFFLMVNKYIPDKLLDKIKEIIGIEKFDDDFDSNGR